MEERDEPVAFTYAIHWTKYNKSYYGVRYAKGCKTTDIWTKYFTSSNKVKEFRAQYGEPDIILIDQMFTDIEEARDYEEWILKDEMLVQSEYFLNKNDRRGPPILSGERYPRYNNPSISDKVSGTKSWFYREKNSAVREKFLKSSPRAIEKSQEYFRKNGYPMQNPETRLKQTGEGNVRYDWTIHLFQHKNGDHFIGTQNEFFKKYLLCRSHVNSLVKGNRNSHKGWTYHGIYSE